MLGFGRGAKTRSSPKRWLTNPLGSVLKERDAWRNETTLEPEGHGNEGVGSGGMRAEGVGIGIVIPTRNGDGFLESKQTSRQSQEESG